MLHTSRAAMQWRQKAIENCTRTLGGQVCDFPPAAHVHVHVRTPSTPASQPVCGRDVAGFSDKHEKRRRSHTTCSTKRFLLLLLLYLCVTVPLVMPVALLSAISGRRGRYPVVGPLHE